MGGEKKRMMAVVVATAMAASCEAFVSPVVSSPNKWSTQSQLWGSLPGGGVAVVPAGNLGLFDPEQEGKLQGTGQLQERIQQGASYLSAAAAAAGSSGSASSVTASMNTASVEAQHFLEDLGVPVNFAKPNSPATATILGRARIITDDAPGDIQHIVMKLPEGMHYVEGQSLSVIPPGVDGKTGRNFAPRLYSIASTRYGDLLDGTTISLCVRRAEFYDEVTGQVDPSKAGACSKFLCDAMPGTTVSVAGPVGKTMLLPKDPSTDVIMIATGTGVAPFRGFMHRLFMEETVARHMFDATAWLVLGVPTTGGLLYKDEFDAMLQNAGPGQLKVDYAISREMKKADGGKLYVQDVIAQNAKEIFKKLDGGANIYFCGLKGMMPNILTTFEEVATSQGIVWADKLKELKANHQWHVEVY
eukprot:scaffold243_cov39-Attheya_sp.AAC.2